MPRSLSAPVSALPALAAVAAAAVGTGALVAIATGPPVVPGAGAVRPPAVGTGAGASAGDEIFGVRHDLPPRHPVGVTAVSTRTVRATVSALRTARVD